MSRFISHKRRCAVGWPLLLFLILPLLAFPELILGRQTLYWTDLSWIHFPRHLFAAEEWLAGRVPLWDPYEDTGLPLLAESQVGVLYPPSALFLTSLSPSLELSLFILIHFSLAALFTFVLARRLGQSPAAATVAGLAFGFGGFLMAQVPNLNIMTGAVWLPLMLYAVMQAGQQRSWLAAMLAGIPLALQIFTAQPQIVFYSLIIMAGYGLYTILTDFFSRDATLKKRATYALRTGLLLAVTVFSGLLLAAPQLLPTFELQQLSVRSNERGLDFLTQNSMPPLMALNLLLPGAFGNNVTGFKGGDPFQEVFIYVGFIPLVLALFSWGSPPKAKLLFFYLLLFGAILMALGGNTPVYRYAIQYLPGFDLFRIPSRWLVAVNLALAILAGFGLDRLSQSGLSRRARRALGLAGLLMIAGLGLSWLFRANLLAWSQVYLNGDNPRLAAAFLSKGFTLDPIYQQRLLGSMLGLRVPALLLITNIVVTGALFTLLAAGRITKQTFSLLAILALAVDLASAGGTTINPTRPDDWWWQLSGGGQYVLEHKEEGRVFPLGMGTEEATVSHLGQYFPSVYRVPSAGGHGSSLRVARYDTFLHQADPVQAIQVTGARYLLALGQMSPDVASTYPLVYNDEAAFVYENPKPLPRVFIVHQAIQASTPAEALAHFQIRRIDPSQTVILETEGQVPALPRPISPDASTTVILSQTPQMVEIQANLLDDGYLVLLDTYYPGWAATVDGQRTPIYRANYIGRAIFLPAGGHRVRFEYQPESFKRGRLLALLMLILIGVTAMVSGKG